MSKLTSCTWRLKPQLHKRNLPTQVSELLICCQSAKGDFVCIAPEFHSEGLVQDVSKLKYFVACTVDQFITRKEGEN
jgi:hypothetical protein